MMPGGPTLLQSACIAGKSPTPPRSAVMWARAFLPPSRCCMDNKIRNFQLHISHRLLTKWQLRLISITWAFCHQFTTVRTTKTGKSHWYSASNSGKIFGAGVASRFVKAVSDKKAIGTLVYIEEILATRGSIIHDSCTTRSRDRYPCYSYRVQT